MWQAPLNCRDPKPGAYLVVTGPAGFTAMPTDTLAKGSVITVQAWGRIEGVWLNHGRPMRAKCMHSALKGEIRRWVSGTESVSTDQSGHFVFTAIPPGTIAISWLEPLDPPKDFPAANRELAEVDVRPGQTSEVRIVTDGRNVTGKLASSAGADDISGLTGWNVSLAADIPAPMPPKDADTPEATSK